MRTVTDSVRSILYSSDTALEAMRSGILNLSAYANTIRPIVEKETWKEVKTGTITVALSRIAAQLLSVEPLRPTVIITDLSIQSHLYDVSFEKTEKLLEQLPQLQTALHHKPRGVFVQTIGMSEVTFITSAEIKEILLETMQEKPKSIYEGLVGITVGFDTKYLSLPNVIYTLISTVASKRINIIEIVSTYTELMFVIEAKDREECVRSLEIHFTSEKTSRPLPHASA